LNDSNQTWKRTHYSKSIDTTTNGTEVTIIGWISSIREHSNIKFITLNDRFGSIQVTLKEGEYPSSLESEILKIRDHTAIAIKGKIRTEPKAPNGIELIPNNFRILSIANKNSPIVIQSRKGVGVETRLDLRAIDLRRNHLQNVFKIRNTVLNSIREYLNDNYFVEVNTPKMIATATEGGAALFPIFYYDREAFLAQSPQLYKEQLTMAFENVFEIAPIFRAEPSRTNRHLSEAMSIDVEKAYVDYTDMMDYLDNLIRYIVQSIKNNNQEELQSLGIELPDISTQFRRITYSQLVENLQNSHKYIRWGDDITPKLLKDLFGDEFYFITDWPSSTKPFYVKAKKKDLTTESSDEDESRGLSESFDLMYGSLELSSGSTRINNKEDLMGNMKKKGLSLDAFDYHLRVFDYGVPPHAGFGLGLERLLMAILKLDNIRDATFYPRDIDRLTP